jgi:hypothetical protein
VTEKFHDKQFDILGILFGDPSNQIEVWQLWV